MSAAEALGKIVGDAGTLDPTRFAIAGSVPSSAFAPATDEEAVALVEAAGSDRLCCVVWGGGSRVLIGGAPARYDFALSTERLVGCVQHEPADLVASFRAGTPLADVPAVLREHGQWLPWETEINGPLTFGGAVATNTSGAPQDGFGSPRDRVLQLTAVTGYGKRIAAGAAVVKNVAGYDLHRLYCGSWGTLGLILSAAVRVEPMSHARELTVSLSGWDEAEARAQDADRLGGILVSFMVSAGEPLLATYRLTGSEKVLDWAESALPPPSPKGEGRVGVPSGARTRFVTRPAETLALARSLHEHYPDAAVRARPISGVVWFASDDPADASQATSIGDRLKAFWRVERGEAERWWSGVDESLSRHIKDAFDPAGVFSPGRFAGGL